MWAHRHVADACAKRVTESTASAGDRAVDFEQVQVVDGLAGGCKTGLSSPFF